MKEEMKYLVMLKKAYNEKNRKKGRYYKKKIYMIYK